MHSQSPARAGFSRREFPFSDEMLEPELGAGQAPSSIVARSSRPGESSEFAKRAVKPTLDGLHRPR